MRRSHPSSTPCRSRAWPRLGVCGWSVTDASVPSCAGHRLLPPFCGHPLPQRSAMCRVYCWRTRGLLYPEPEGHSLAVPLSGCWWNLKATAQLSFCPPPRRPITSYPMYVTCPWLAISWRRAPVTFLGFIAGFLGPYFKSSLDI